jgi:hypothetical protein
MYVALKSALRIEAPKFTIRYPHRYEKMEARVGGLKDELVMTVL